MALQDKVKALPNIYYEVIECTKSQSRLHVDMYVNLNQELMDMMMEDRDNTKLKLKD